MRVVRIRPATSAMARRPRVTAPQNTARASWADVAFTPWPVSRVVPQLPNIVSHTP